MAKNNTPRKPIQGKIVERFYEHLGPIYNFIYSDVLFDQGRRVALKFLELHGGECVLEVGVGTGLTLPMYPRNCKIVGIDLSDSMLAEARKLIEDYHLEHVTLKAMDATKLDFPDNHFDAVLGNLFISATTEPEAALLEMKRVCKPGGNIVLMNHFKSENKLLGLVESALDPFTTKLVGFRAALERDKLLAKVGLEVKDFRKVNLFGLWTAVVMVNKK
jgi:phosphatidylethanolamine/phosphatidyl-N-methylethanolamine N-methyltransferase